ncbi:MAG: hypothetical protein OEM02_06150, partial [Desulfobulbaceae bacterium]|nr:hypothetical protein [Desulfobulbaceae bacterium]
TLCVSGLIARRCGAGDHLRQLHKSELPVTTYIFWVLLNQVVVIIVTSLSHIGNKYPKTESLRIPTY